MRRVLAVPALLLLLAAPAGAQSFGKNKVRFDEFRWQEYPTPHFRISFYDPERIQLAKIASFAESAYDDLARHLNFQINDPVPLIVFATHAEFEQTNVIVDFIPEGVGAFAVPARNRMVLPADLPDLELHRLIHHELTHIFQYEILFQGKLSKAITSGPPHWFMEGMASYLGDDEDSRARAVMRDAVLSDQVPSIGEETYGYFSYRFGHMVFKFVEAEWGIEGLRDFVFEARNSLGGNIGKTVRRAFDLDIEEFDARFRSWLRKYYQDATLDRGDPQEFGPSFRVAEESRSAEASPAASPSGEIIAAFSTYKNDVDTVLLGVPDRRLLRNLTRGNTTSYQYQVAQLLTVGPIRGRDLSFSPDGSHVAVFARKGKSRVLLLLDALHGGVDREIRIPVGQAMSPAFSPDGSTVAFGAYHDGQADIYLLDLDSGEVENVTNDDAFDSSPAFTPDGSRLVYSSETGPNAKIYEVVLADPSKRNQITFGPGDDEGAAFSRDGKSMYFASDRDAGIFDLYALDLGNRALTRLTKVFGAALNPTPVVTVDGERVVYQAYTKGRWLLYVTDPGQGTVTGTEEAPKEVTEREAYVPSVTVAVSPEKVVEVKRHKLFLDDAQVLVGVDESQTVISQTYLGFADHYGDRRFSILFESVSGYSNFQLAYSNLSERLQWGAAIYDDRAYFVGIDTFQGLEYRAKRLYRQTGAEAFGKYPISLYHRVEGSVGYMDLDYNVLTPVADGFVYVPYKFHVPYLQFGLVGDTTFWRDYGPHAGRRWSVRPGLYFDLDNGGLLTREIRAEWRQYVPLSRRNELALRLFAGWADGNSPTYFYFGGLDTMRGFDYRSLVGNRAAYLNAEWRFPLIDYLILPWLRLANLRGRFFLDVGAAYFDFDGVKYTQTPFGVRPGYDFMEDGQLVDGVSSYGFGFSVNLFGLPMHWDFAKRWNFDATYDNGFVTTFWMGFRY
jgi:Tol biopolymer transport system component